MTQVFVVLRSFFRHALITLLLLWAFLSFFGGEIDKICLEGRFSAVQAEAVNSLPWGKCPSYRNGNCRVEEGDRMLARECSEVSRFFFLQDWW